MPIAWTRKWLQCTKWGKGGGGVGYSMEFGVIIIQKGELLFKKKRIFNIGLFLYKGWNKACLHGWGTFLKLAVPGTFMLAFEVWSVEITTFCTGKYMLFNLYFKYIQYIQYIQYNTDHWILEKIPKQFISCIYWFQRFISKINWDSLRFCDITVFQHSNAFQIKQSHLWNIK